MTEKSFWHITDLLLKNYKKLKELIIGIIWCEVIIGNKLTYFFYIFYELYSDRK